MGGILGQLVVNHCERQHKLPGPVIEELDGALERFCSSSEPSESETPKQDEQQSIEELEKFIDVVSSAVNAQTKASTRQTLTFLRMLLSFHHPDFSHEARVQEMKRLPLTGDEDTELLMTCSLACYQHQDQSAAEELLSYSLQVSRPKCCFPTLPHSEAGSVAFNEPKPDTDRKDPGPSRVLVNRPSLYAVVVPPS